MNEWCICKMMTTIIKWIDRNVDWNVDRTERSVSRFELKFAKPNTRQHNDSNTIDWNQLGADQCECKCGQRASPRFAKCQNCQLLCVCVCADQYYCKRMRPIPLPILQSIADVFVSNGFFSLILICWLTNNCLCMKTVEKNNVFGQCHTWMRIVAICFLFEWRHACAKLSIGRHSKVFRAGEMNLELVAMRNSNDDQQLAGHHFAFALFPAQAHLHLHTRTRS